jgi:taurine dioxygenase
MTLSITKLTPAIGARIDGIDASKPRDAATAKALYQAWLDHVVLYFPAQDITPEQHKQFARVFGTVAERARDAATRPEGSDYDSNFMLISNVRDEKGQPIGSLPDGEMWFHHDTSYVPEPQKGTFLYAIDIPSTGGNTMFASMYAAYEKIPAALKAKLAGRRVLHVYDYTTTARLDPDGDLAGIKHQWQPIFVHNPESGRTALFVNRLMTARIEGLDRAESDAILDELFAIAEDRSHVYEHVWTPGDLLIWDNRCSTHARTDFPAGERRLLRRCTIEGGPLVAAEVAAA